MTATSPAPASHRSPKSDPPADDAPAGGNGLLWVLLAVAVAFAVLRPRAPLDYLKLVDWQTIGALAGLLAITQGVEKSGMLQATAQRLLGRMTTLRSLAFFLTATAALLSAMVTNDVSLFLLVPLTRVLATQAHLPLARLVVLEALAVNAGSALTPIGNPQNLYLWHRSGESFVGFMGMLSYGLGFIADSYGIRRLVTVVTFSLLSLFLGFLYARFVVFRDAEA